jgi:uncharacterized lipoprotein YajG
MKKQFVLKTLTLSLTAAFVLAACAQPEKADSTATVSTVSSGPAMAAVIQGSATVEKINRSTREVTLRRQASLTSARSDYSPVYSVWPASRRG